MDEKIQSTTLSMLFRICVVAMRAVSQCSRSNWSVLRRIRSTDLVPQRTTQMLFRRAQEPQPRWPSVKLKNLQHESLSLLLSFRCILNNSSGLSTSEKSAARAAGRPFSSTSKSALCSYIHPPGVRHGSEHLRTAAGPRRRFRTACACTASRSQCRRRSRLHDRIRSRWRNTVCT
jgi:hypothetical protein